MADNKTILLADLDIFGAVGGGQTVYQSIVRGRPQDRFFYFTQGEPADAPRPANATAIPLVRRYKNKPKKLAMRERYFYHVYAEAMDMAAAAAGALGPSRLDVVDTPDYRRSGLFLRQALATHGIEVGTLALALHGTISSALTMAWPWKRKADRLFAELRLTESLQFASADCRYAISASYAEELQRRTPGAINMLDPLLTVRPAEPRRAAPGRGPPTLAFIGRRERRKGPDIFLDLASWLPEGTFGELLLVGGEGFNHEGHGGSAILTSMIRRRQLPARFVERMSQEELRRLCQGRTVVVTPSRYDQFNLVALECLLDGCPVLVSRHAGVARFLRERLPELAWLETDLGCDRTAVTALTDLLRHYDGRRAQICDALARAGLVADHDSLGRIYTPAAQTHLASRQLLADLADRFDLLVLDRDGARSMRGALRGLLRGQRKGRSAPVLPLRRMREKGPRGRMLVRAVRRTARDAGLGLLQRLNHASFDLRGRALKEAAGLRKSGKFFEKALRMPERSSRERDEKRAYLSRVVQERRLDRMRVFRELFRLERLSGNDLIAATYGLRLMRWAGRDQFRLLPFVTETLAANGYPLEAEVAQLVYGPAGAGADPARAFLDRRFEVNRDKPTRELELVDDRRTAEPAQVAVIVSLYNAADKLPTFLSMLAQQSLVQAGRCEIVLVDSGSPAHESRLFAELWPSSRLNAVAVRSAGRETIQAAWNRGIALARAPYLAFLGADEALHPQALERLAAELDRDPSLDWVMADSVVTEVDRQGVFNFDIMTYDRRGYRQDWHYLDCTFLSYVGGLYRRSIHERFGYYDETFRAAGDTEFKNRVLPRIRSRHLPGLLGIFNNYPEARTTQHPRAEIEDLRAWYLHRTVSGLGYAFDQRPIDDAVALLKDTFCYRKCFCEHWSTDLDLAASLTRYLSTRADAGSWGSMVPAIDELAELYGGFELVEQSGREIVDAYRFARQWQRLDRLRAEHQKAFALERPPAYDIFNDNRYEQHWWSWSA